MPKSPIRKFRLADPDWLLLGCLAELKRTKPGKYGINMSAIVRDLIRKEAHEKLSKKDLEEIQKKSALPS